MNTGKLVRKKLKKYSVYLLFIDLLQFYFTNYMLEIHITNMYLSRYIK